PLRRRDLRHPGRRQDLAVDEPAGRGPAHLLDRLRVIQPLGARHSGGASFWPALSRLPSRLRPRGHRADMRPARLFIGTVLSLGSILAGARAQVPSDLPADFRQALRVVPLNSDNLVATLKPFVVRRSVYTDQRKVSSAPTFQTVIDTN